MSLGGIPSKQSGVAVTVRALAESVPKERRRLASWPLTAVLLASTALVSSVNASHAQPFYWTGAESGDYFDDQNWNTGEVPPDLTGIVYINQSPAVEISVSANTSLSVLPAQLSIGDGAGSDGKLLITIPAADEPAGYASLSLGSSDTYVVGVGTNGGTGLLQFSFAHDAQSGTNYEPSQVRMDFQQLLVGDGTGSVGTLNILSGGKNYDLDYNQNDGLFSGSAFIGSNGGTGNAEISGSWNIGAGKTDPETDISTEGLHIGYGAGSTGTVNVLSGGKVSRAAYPTHVGSPAPGSLAGIVVGEAGGTGTLNISGESLDGSGPSTVVTGAGLSVGHGVGSTGNVNVLSGGKLTSYNVDDYGIWGVLPAQVGAEGGTGHVLVSGEGSILQIGGRGVPYPGNSLSTGDLFLGVGTTTSGGSGSLTLADGGHAHIGQMLGIYTDNEELGYNYGLTSEGQPANGIVFLAHDTGTSGSLNFGAAAGSAAQAPGTLAAAGVVFGAGDGSIVFNHTGDIDFDLPVSGEGTIAVHAGTTTINTDNRDGFTNHRLDYDPDEGYVGPVEVDYDAGFSGRTDMFGGTLMLGHDGAIGGSKVHGLGSATLGYLDGITTENLIDINENVTLSLLVTNGNAATQAGIVSGEGNIDKKGAGILTLTGNNAITGVVAISEGTLALDDEGQVSEAEKVIANGTFDISQLDNGAAIKSLAGSGSVILGSQTLTLTAANDTFSGVIQDTGGLTLTSGIQTLSGQNSYSGPTTVNGGVLRAGAENAFSQSSAYTVATMAGLDLDGYDQTLTSLENAGIVRFGSTPGTELTISEDYVGDGGTLLFNTYLGGDGSPTDHMHVIGSTSGNSFIEVNNVGGPGVQTVDGIRIITVDDDSNGVFSLVNGYDLEGQTAVIAGAYGYLLHKNGVTTPEDGNWYLRSRLLDEPDVPVYQPGSPLYESMPRVALGFMEATTLQQRVGNRGWQGSGGEFREGQGVWGRIDGTYRHFEGSSTTGTSTSQRQWRAEAGIDIPLVDGDSGTLMGGLSAHVGQIYADVTSRWGRGRNETTGYGIGASATWYGSGGFYADAQGRLSWLDTDLTSRTLGERMGDGVKGLGHMLSIEVGQRFALSDGFSLVPQAQLSWTGVRYDDFTDPYDASVKAGYHDSLQARLGAAVHHQQEWSDASGMTRRLNLYGGASVYQELLDETMSVDVSGTALKSKEGRTWLGGDLGVTYNFNDDAYSLYGEVQAATNVSGSGDSYRVFGKAGLRVKW